MKKNSKKGVQSIVTKRIGVVLALFESKLIQNGNPRVHLEASWGSLGASDVASSVTFLDKKRLR